MAKYRPMNEKRCCHSCKYRSNGFGYPCSKCFTKIRGYPYVMWEPRTFEQKMADKESKQNRPLSHKNFLGQP